MNSGRRWNSISEPVRRMARVVTLLLCVFGAKGTAAAEGQRLRLGIALTAYRTDNLLQYSDSLLQRFDEGATPTHFSIKSTDDGVWHPSISLTWETDRPGGHGRDLRLRGSGEYHGRNGTADFRSLSLAWREYFGADRRLSISGYYLPSYYLRQLRDEDVTPAVYRRAEFSLLIGSAGWRQRLARRLRGEVSYQIEHRGYNPDFTERSSNTHEVKGSLEWVRLPQRGSVELQGGYRKSIARANDADAISADDADVSYHGFLAGLGGRMDFTRRRGWRPGGDVTYEYARRNYESGRITDKSHYGRADRLHTVEVGLRVSPIPDLGVRGFYHFEDNKASFPVGGGPTSDPASYTEHRWGVSLDWSAVLWASLPGRGATEPGEAR